MRLIAPDWALLAACVASLVVSCYLISARKFFWNDEIIAWKVVTDPSLKHMLWAVAHACDGSPPLFHVALRAWSRIFGSGILALRYFSCAGFCVALLALWVTLRRHFRLEAVAFGILSVWFTSRILLNQLAEARNYGLYLALIAIALVLIDHVANQTSTSRLTLVALFATTVALTYSHYFGILYSGIMLAVLIGSDASRRVRRPRVYLSIVAGWLPLALWIPAVLREQALFRDRSYYVSPTWREISETYENFHLGWPLLGFAIVCALMWLLFRPQAAKTRNAGEPRSFIPLVTIALLFTTLLLVFYAAFIVGLHPPFADRYFLPNLIAYPLLIAWLADRVLGRISRPAAVARRTVVGIAWAALFVAILCAEVRYAARWIGGLEPISFQVVKHVPPDLPIVVEDPHQWMQATYYEPSKRFYYILDRGVAMDPESPVSDAFTYNEKSGWKQAGYWSDGIVTTDDFVCRHERFGVIDDEHRLWFRHRIAENPAFDVKLVKSVRFGWFYIVTRKPGTLLPACAQ